MIAGKNDQFHVDMDKPPKEDSRWVDAGTRQEERLAGVPAIYKTTLERLACELAMRMDPAEEIFQRYRYTPDAAAALMESKSFTELLDRVSAELRDNGLSFKTKMKAVAEDLIPHAHEMATDPLCSAAVRADLIKWAAKMAGYEPPPAKGDAGAGAGGFSLSITFAGQAPTSIVTGREPALIEHQP